MNFDISHATAYEIDAVLIGQGFASTTERRHLEDIIDEVHYEKAPADEL